MSWKEFWQWFEQSTLEMQTMALSELNRDSWLKNLSAHTQADIFVDAPIELLKQLKHLPYIKTEAIQEISKRINKRR